MLSGHYLLSASKQHCWIEKNYYTSHCGCKRWDTRELGTWSRVMQTASCESDYQVGVSSAHRPASNQHVPTGSGLISLPAFLSFFSSCPHALERRWGPHLYNSGLFPPSKEQGWHSSLHKHQWQETDLHPTCKLLITNQPPAMSTDINWDLNQFTWGGK